MCAEHNRHVVHTTHRPLTMRPQQPAFPAKLQHIAGTCHHGAFHSLFPAHECETCSHRESLPRADHLLCSIFCVRDNVDLEQIVIFLYSS